MITMIKPGGWEKEIKTIKYSIESNVVIDNYWHSETYVGTYN